MRKIPLLSPFLSLLILTACVTINIYFPAAAAEDAARTIVRDVLDVAPEESSQDTQDVPQDGAMNQTASRFLYAVLNVLIVSVHAEANININTPAIGQLRASLKKRSPALTAFYRAGSIGLSNDGLISVRDLNSVPLKDRNTVKKLVADDNADRQALYREIARANDHPEWNADIQATFSRVWVEEAASGTWYQDAAGNWKQK